MIKLRKKLKRLVRKYAGKLNRFIDKYLEPFFLFGLFIAYIILLIVVLRVLQYVLIGQ